MANPSFPPVLPDRVKKYITVEVVDENTIKFKALDGTVLQTLTKAQYEAMVKPDIKPVVG
jgi:hypothetical protein